MDLLSAHMEEVAAVITLDEIREIQAIAQTGLNYTHCPFDKERYERLMSLSAKLLAKGTETSLDVMTNWCFDEVGYATPKLGVRAIVLNKNQEILLVRERSNKRWALPGGWADVNLSAAESIEQELLEETGLKGKARYLLALFDKLKHDHPAHSPHTYLAFFFCECEEGPLQGASEEVLEVRYFSITHLPELCTHRGTKKQIEVLYEKALQSPQRAVLFD